MILYWKMEMANPHKGFRTYTLNFNANLLMMKVSNRGRGQGKLSGHTRT